MILRTDLDKFSERSKAVNKQLGELSMGIISNDDTPYPKGFHLNKHGIELFAMALIAVIPSLSISSTSPCQINDSLYTIM